MNSTALAAELAVAFWRLARLHEKSLPSPFALSHQGAQAQARYLQEQVQRALAEQHFELVDCTGAEFTPGLPFSATNLEEFLGASERLVVHQVLEPAVTVDGRLLRMGKVVLRDGGGSDVPRD